MIQIELDNRANNFRPGDQISGTVQWSQLNKTPESVDIRLIWYTVGKGDTDNEIVDSHVLKNAPEQGEEQFSFTAPGRPYSFAGKLISLLWAIEVVMLPSRESERVEFEISPGGSQIVLTPVEDE